MTVSQRELFDALAAHDPVRVRAALASGADANAPEAHYPYFTPLHAAIDALDDSAPLEMLESLLEAGADPNRWDETRDSTPLLMACLRGQRTAARRLLAAGADPNVRAGEGAVPLHLAVDQGDLELVALLLERGAGESLAVWGGMPGRTALGLAATRSDLAMVELLLGAGARVDQEDDAGMTALDHARESGLGTPQQRADIIARLEVAAASASASRPTAVRRR